MLTDNLLAKGVDIFLTNLKLNGLLATKIEKTFDSADHLFLISR